MKKLNLSGFAGIATALLAVAGLAPSANAQLALTSGSFTINAQGFTSDSLSGNPADFAPGGLVVGPGGEREDTWGVFQIKSIYDGGLEKFADNLGTEYWGILYGSYDTGVTPLGGGDFKFTATGLNLSIYKITTADAVDAAFNGVAGQGIGGRLGLTGYNGITNVGGSLVLTASVAGNMTSFFFGSTGGTSASANLNLGVNTLFSTGGLPLTDLSFTIGGLTSNVPYGWTDKFLGPIDGSFSAVPEPSTYGLFAAGALLGLVAFRRMKVRAQAV